MGLDDRLALVERNPEKAGGSTGHGGAPVTSASGRAEAENLSSRSAEAMSGDPGYPQGEAVRDRGGKMLQGVKELAQQAWRPQVDSEPM